MRLLRHFPFALSVADAAVAARMRAAGSTVALSWHEGHSVIAAARGEILGWLGQRLG